MTNVCTCMCAVHCVHHSHNFSVIIAFSLNNFLCDHALLKTSLECDVGSRFQRYQAHGLYMYMHIVHCTAHMCAHCSSDFIASSSSTEPNSSSIFRSRA